MFTEDKLNEIIEIILNGTETGDDPFRLFDVLN
jgi:hypothetical protein